MRKRIAISVKSLKKGDRVEVTGTRKYGLCTRNSAGGTASCVVGKPVVLTVTKRWYDYETGEHAVGVDDAGKEFYFGEFNNKVRKASRGRRGQHLDNVESIGPLDGREVARAIRDAIVAEEQAVNQYETIVDSTDDPLVSKVLQEIADEEKVHVGELQELLRTMLDDEQGFLDEGADEVEEAMKEASARRRRATAETAVYNAMNSAYVEPIDFVLALVGMAEFASDEGHSLAVQEDETSNAIIGLSNDVLKLAKKWKSRLR